MKSPFKSVENGAEANTNLRFPDFHDLQLMRAHYTTHVFPRHYHETYVIEVVRQGADEFFCDGKTYTATAGQIVLINPHEVHTGKSVGRRPLQYCSLYPTADMMRGIARQLPGFPDDLPMFARRVVEDERIARLLAGAYAVASNRVDAFTAQSILVNTLAELIHHHAEPHARTVRAYDDRDAVKRAREYMLEHYDRNITLAELAKVAALSPYHLLRVFRKAVGFPPHEFLINVRVEKARQLIAKGHPLAFTAMATGFYDQSHLNKHFKRIIGLTPGQYR